MLTFAVIGYGSRGTTYTDNVKLFAENAVIAAWSCGMCV